MESFQFQTHIQGEETIFLFKYSSSTCSFSAAVSSIYDDTSSAENLQDIIDGVKDSGYSAFGSTGFTISLVHGKADSNKPPTKLVEFDFMLADNDSINFTVSHQVAIPALRSLLDRVQHETNLWQAENYLEFLQENLIQPAVHMQLTDLSSESGAAEAA